MSAIALRPARRRPIARAGVRALHGRWRPATDCSRACGRQEGDCRSIRPPRWRTPRLRCGNGAIGLSARANLHLRGLSERTLPDLHARLEEAGLIDADPEVERLRNIVASPLDDLDPEASFDLGRERRGAGDAARGGRAPAAAAGEIQLRPRRAGAPAARRRRGGHPLRGVARRDVRGVSRRRRRAGRPMRAGETGDVAARLGLAFLALAGAGEAAPRRMRALVERTGAAAVFAEAGCKTKRAARSQRRAVVARHPRRAANSARRSSSARRRPSAKSTRFASRR